MLEWINILSKNDIHVYKRINSKKYSYSLTYPRCYPPNYIISVWTDPVIKLTDKNIEFIYNFFLKRKVLVDVDVRLNKLMLTFNINEYNNRVRSLKVNKIINNL